MRNLFVCYIWVGLLTGCSQNEERLNYLEHRVDSLSRVLENTQNVYRFSYSFKLDSINPEVKVVNTEFDTCYLEQILENTDRLYFYYSDQNQFAFWGQYKVIEV